MSKALEPVSAEVVSTPASELAELHAEAQEHLTHRRAAATFRAYGSDWLILREFLVTRCGVDPETLPVYDEFDGDGRPVIQPGLPTKPVATNHVVYFLTEQVRTRKFSTVARRVAAIAHFHEAAGFASPTRERVVIELMESLRRRARGERPTQKAAADTKPLREMIRLCPEGLAGLRDKTILSVGFAGAFRRSELVSLNVEDLRETEHGYEAMLWSSKGDQYGDGEKVGIPLMSHPDSCPVRLLRAWLAASGLTEGPMFRQINKGGQLITTTRDGGRLSDRTIANVVKKAALRAGFDPQRFAGHSLRSGLITAASDGGATTRSIMAQTRHKSAAMIDRYYRKEDKFTDNAASYTGL